MNPLCLFCGKPAPSGKMACSACAKKHKDQIQEIKETSRHADKLDKARESVIRAAKLHAKAYDKAQPTLALWKAVARLEKLEGK